MADISGLGMMSYYTPFAMYRQQQQIVGQQPLAQQMQQTQVQQTQQHASSSSVADGGQQYWYGYHGHPHGVHHQAAGQQYLDPAEVLPSWSHHAHAYTHLQYQHHQPVYQQSQISGVTDWTGDEPNTGVGAGETSPPNTISGSEMSNSSNPTSPPTNNSNNSISPNNRNNSNNLGHNSNVNTNTNVHNNSTTPRPAQVRSPYEWMKKTSYQSQPNPACNVTINNNADSTVHEVCIIDTIGKTRTKDKYRVVYTDHQRLELEKEFHYSRYITIRRKAELALSLSLSERQVKIWFQNRRAKERKQMKKREEMERERELKAAESVTSASGAMASLSLGGMLGGLMHNGSSSSLSHSSQMFSLNHAPPTLQAPQTQSMPNNL
ncbi:homeotic protein caudal-like isoform X1 [Apis cerana]|uniref:homeotic protein caudal-like isoform X1 n=1 Tax=Apis cerana TaxID=7461 RepID=UPI0007E2B5AC|nr:homeotic protein caudal-like isoform X1 [Apis cerana]